MAAPIAEGPGFSRRRLGRYRHDRVVTQDLTVVFRAVAAIAAAVLIVFGLTALARINWDEGGFDAAAVDVADVTFTPVVAVAMTVVGLVALLAAAARDRGSKLVVGVLLVCVGIVAFIARPDTGRVVLEDAHGSMTIVVGAVLLLAAMAMSRRATHRIVESDAVYE